MKNGRQNHLQLRPTRKGSNIKVKSPSCLRPPFPMQSLSTALVSRGKGHDTYMCLHTHKHMGVASPLCPSHSHWVHRGPHPIRDSRVLPRGCVMAGLLQPGIVVALTSPVTSHAEVNGWWALPLGSAFHRAGICLPLQHHLPSHTARGLMISVPQPGFSVLPCISSRLSLAQWPEGFLSSCQSGHVTVSSESSQGPQSHVAQSPSLW